MKAFLPIRLHLAVSPLLALLVGYLFQAGGEMAAPPILTPSVTPFWQVMVTVYEDSPPQIEKVSKVEIAQSIVIRPGSSVIQILTDDGQVLHEQAFDPVFASGDFAVTKLIFMFTLPDDPAAVKIFVRTSQGEAVYDLVR
jgi:hypothetical protein